MADVEIICEKLFSGVTIFKKLVKGGIYEN